MSSATPFTSSFRSQDFSPGISGTGRGKGVVKVIYYYEQTFIISTTTVGKSYDYYDLCKDSKGNILFGETQTTGCSSSDTLVEDFDRNYTYSKLG